MSDPDSKPSQPSPFALTADLSPADAAKAKDALMEAFSAAESTQSALSIDIEGEGGTPCALQLLVATKRSAEAAKVELILSEQATSMLASVHAD